MFLKTVKRYKLHRSMLINRIGGKIMYVLRLVLKYGVDGIEFQKCRWKEEVAASLSPTLSNIFAGGSMSLSSKTPRFGHQLLADTKGALARAQATRTADAVERVLCTAETHNDRDNYEGAKELSEDCSPGTGGAWVRHDSANGNSLTFTRSEGETITIIKSRCGDRWHVVYDEPIHDLPA